MALSCFGAPPKVKLAGAAVACLGAVAAQVAHLYRGPAKCVLVNDQGELEFESEGGPAVEMSTLENICILQRASLALGDGLRARCPALHLRSDGSVVSCFGAGRAHLLVVLAEMHATSAELFDAAAAENRLREVLDSLAAALDP